jgi:hypothetical protein
MKELETLKLVSQAPSLRHGNYSSRNFSFGELFSMFFRHRVQTVAFLVTAMWIATATFAGFSPVTAAPKAKVKKSPPPIATPKPSLKNRLIFPNSGIPSVEGKRNGSGGTRGETCQETPIPFTALIPAKYIGLTASRSPVFWFYSPYPISAKHSIEFQLIDNQTDKTVYEFKSQTDRQPGLIGISIDNPAFALTPDRQYQWKLTYHCNGSAEDDLLLFGGIQHRTSPELANQLSKAKDVRDRLRVYANSELWYETVNELITARRKKPNDLGLRKDWEDLFVNSPPINLPKVVNILIDNQY